MSNDQSLDNTATENNITLTPVDPAQYTAWSSVKHLGCFDIVGVLLAKEVDVAETVERLLAAGKTTHTRQTVKKNLELVWKECISNVLVSGRNTRL